MDGSLDEAMDRVREREARLVRMEDRLTQVEKDFGEVKTLLQGIRNYVLVGIGTTITGVITAGVIYVLHWNR